MRILLNRLETEADSTEANEQKTIVESLLVSHQKEVQSLRDMYEIEK